MRSCRLLLSTLLAALLSLVAVFSSGLASPAAAASLYSISGKILGQDGAPPVGAVVGYVQGSGYPSGYVSPAADGEFTVPVPASGTYQLAIAYLPSQAAPGSPYASGPSNLILDSSPITVSGNVAVGTLSVPPTQQYRARFVDATGKPIEGVSISGNQYYGAPDVGWALNDTLSISKAFMGMGQLRSGQDGTVQFIGGRGQFGFTATYVDPSDALTYTENWSTSTADASGVSTVTFPNVIAPVRPGSPSQVVAAAGRGQITVSWTAPTNDGGAPLTGYEVTATPVGSTTPALTLSPAADTATGTLDGLQNGTSYVVAVAATNGVGPSVPTTAANPVTPQTVPGQPIIGAVKRGDTAATVNWQPPVDDGGSAITSYTVTASPGGRQATVPGNATTATVKGLTNGNYYTFQVVATNDVGNSPASYRSASVVPAGAPKTVTGVSARVQAKNDVYFSWKLTSGNGAPITSYLAYSSDGRRIRATANQNGRWFLNLPPGRHTFRVIARNAVGSSPASSPVTARTY